MSKSCRHCKTKFAPVRPLQVVCSPFCAIQITATKNAQVRKKAVALDKKETKAKLVKLKTLSQWLKECRAIVQKIARIRDRDDGCISCLLPATWGGQWHGSHFRSHGAASAVQLNLWNIHKSCSACNLHKSGNIIEYRPRIIAKIGNDKVEWLMAQNQIVRYGVDYCTRFKRVMGKRLKRMEKQYKRDI